MNSIFASLDKQTPKVLELQTKLTSMPALGPLNGGKGESEKANFILSYLHSLGIEDVRELNAPSDDVPCGYRPNIVATIPGVDTSKTLWVIN
jgi:succinyl-diaminopimelate desuccinylase